MEPVTQPATPETDAVEFDLVYTAADVRSAQLRIRPRRHVFVLLWVAAASGAVAWGMDGGLATFAVGLAAGLGVIGFQLFVWCPRRVLRMAREAHWVISATGVRMVSPGLETTLAWQRLGAVRLTRHQLMLELGKKQSVPFVPVRFLPPGSPERIGAFARAAGVPTHGFPDPA